MKRKNLKYLRLLPCSDGVGVFVSLSISPGVISDYITYIEMGVFSDEIPVCGVQYVGLLHPICIPPP
jgi:hypothetical protein